MRSAAFIGKSPDAESTVWEELTMWFYPLTARWSGSRILVTECVATRLTTLRIFESALPDRSMPPKPSTTLDVRIVADWRRWLAKHHDSSTEIWLVFHKRHTGTPSIEYLDALDEALCYGWIDSLVKRLDDDRYARKFTPRKADSRWSDVNRKRYAALRASGRLEPPGIARAPTDRSYAPKPPRTTVIPKYIIDAVKKRRAAWEAFEQLAPSHQRRYVGWIDSAKQEETKLRRLREVIDVLAAGKKLGLK
jgi:uncharacterized protein YdeI (YjbR/CyaY-like superfamily)